MNLSITRPSCPSQDFKNAILFTSNYLAFFLFFEEQPDSEDSHEIEDVILPHDLLAVLSSARKDLAGRL